MVLNPDEAAALTRLVMGFCLGKGSLCLYSRSYVLQIAQPKALAQYSRHQWDRVRQFLPATKPPRYYRIEDEQCVNEAGQWRLRVSSLFFETAHRLLYPEGGFAITSEALELLGAEAISMLWADRGRVLMTRQQNFCTGRLNLSRYSFEGAAMVEAWIRTLTGARGRVHHSPRRREAPMLYYDNDDMLLLLDGVRRTWAAQAECLSRKFRRPKDKGDDQERLQAEMWMPQTLPMGVPTRAVLQGRAPGRRLPGEPFARRAPLLTSIPAEAE